MPIGIQTPGTAAESTPMTSGPTESYQERKDRSILRQAIYKSTLESPGLCGLPIPSKEAFLQLVEDVAEAIILKVNK